VDESRVEKETSSNRIEKRYPIAEIFTSPQGEGLYTGTLMTFVRFAGCSVGKTIRDPKEIERFCVVEGLRILPVYRERCTTYDGREFLCDTDFRTKDVLTVKEIIARIPAGVGHICLTGGEPMMHDLLPLMDGLRSRMADLLEVPHYAGQHLGYNPPFIHVETSGTIMAPDTWLFDEGDIWLTVSPKLGVLDDMISLADEVKILVDSKFDESKLPMSIHERIDCVWIQPVNAEWHISKQNMDCVLALQKKHPSWRISTQMHKIWGVR
jgi:7-carboxy-7-deazaguanine synthase